MYICHFSICLSSIALSSYARSPCAHRPPDISCTIAQMHTMPTDQIYLLQVCLDSFLHPFRQNPEAGHAKEASLLLRFTDFQIYLIIKSPFY